MEIPVNKYQTEITEDLLESLPKEVQEGLIDIIHNVEFVGWLISPNRGYAKDRPRDKNGKIIVDLAHPHILEDMDYFRPSALHFEEYGTYTNLRPNSNPNSEYGKWLRQERDRCWDGYVRESDGEWVTGFMYFYLNYGRMIITKIRKGTKQADRIENFPEIWEGVYWRFHYMDQARNGGMYNDYQGGNHCAELAARGKAFAYSQDVETPQGKKKWADINIGDDLFAPDGTTTKVIDIPFDKEHDVYKMTLADGRTVFTTLEHLWKINKNGENWNKLYSTKDILDSKYINRFAIEVSKGVDYEYKEVPIDPYLLGLMLGDGSFTISKYNQAQFTSREEDVLVYSSILKLQFKSVGNTKTHWLINYPEFGKKARELNLHNKVSSNKFIPECYKYNSRNVRKQVLIGLFDTDGTVHDSGKPELCTSSKQLAEDVCWIARSLGYNTTCWIKSPKYKYKGEQRVGKTCYIVYVQTTDCLFNLPRKIKLCGKRGKRLDSRVYKTPIKSIEYSHREKCKCVTVDREDGLFLIGDFITTHNSKSYSMASSLGRNFILGENILSHKKVLSAVVAYQKEFLTKDGVINKFLDIVDFCATNTQFPRRRLTDSISDMTWIMGYKDTESGTDSGTNNSVLGVSIKDDVGKIRGKRASYIGIEEFGSAPNLLTLYNVLLPSVQEGEYTFGLLYLQGTAAEDASDFSGAQEIMYNPRGYNMYALPNVYDKVNQGKPEFIFFFPGYINRKGCYNKDGVSDVVQAIIEILLARYKVKYNTADPKTLLRTIAETPITPAEAIIKVGVNMFPVTDLTERLLQLDSNPSEYDDVYTGELIINNSGEVEYKMTSAQPIRDFPHKDNKIAGAIEIFQMPEIDKKTNTVFGNRYILGCLKEGELVNTDSGFKKVEYVTLDDKLVNIDGKYVKIHNLQRYKNTEPVYKVKLSSIIDSTTFSAEHPIYCCTPKMRYNSYSRVKRLGVPERYYEYNFDFRKVSELKPGDVVKSPILYTNETKLDRFNNPDIWYLFGIILGDGWASSNGYSMSISFNRKEKYLVNRCKSIVENILGRSFTLAKKEDSVLEYTFCHKELNEYFSAYFGRGAKNKHIDFSLKTIPYEYRKNLILGYIDSDGCIYRNTVNITSISKTLLSDIQDWLFSMRITSSIKLLRDEGIHIIDDVECKTEVTYLLSIGTIGLNTIKDWGIDSMKVGDYTKVEALNHNRKDIVFDGDYMYIKVKSIDVEDYTGDVYNFECDTHTFMCNYIPTHNCDPYDDDTSNTMSLGSIFVLDLWTDKIVAEYTGRPAYADDFYEICRRLTMFYNGSLLYENNKKGLFAYFSSNNSIHLLADQPDFLLDKQLVKDAGFGNKRKGVNATAPINAYARSLLRDWLVQPVATTVKQGDEEIEVTVPNLFFIRDRALIKELIGYNTAGNFDRISAMGMLMLHRQDKMILYQGNPRQGIETRDADYLGNDPFFSRNYKSTDY